MLGRLMLGGLIPGRRARAHLQPLLLVFAPCFQGIAYNDYFFRPVVPDPLIVP
jgi:hypothetical protein